MYVYNKIDQLCIEELDELADQPHSVLCSLQERLGLDWLLQATWDHMGLTRVYTKKRGEPPDFSGAVVLRRGQTVKDLCSYVHRDFVSQFKVGLVWGASGKHSPQRVGLSHVLEDEDVIQIIKK